MGSSDINGPAIRSVGTSGADNFHKSFLRNELNPATFLYPPNVPMEQNPQRNGIGRESITIAAAS